ncbi:MAG: hypothetical protein NTZ17_04390 [Phycisphaerae bacterium]|nr:hypothetical protein [Phycisphaerae bacterium]
MKTLSALLLMCLFIASAHAKYSGGTGEPNDPYQTSAASDDAKAFDAFAGWLRRFEAGAAERRAEDGCVTIAASTTPVSRDLLAEGANLAAARRTAMLQLMRENPRLALHRALRWDEHVILPPKIRDLVEEPFSEMGDLDVVPDCRPLSERQGLWQTHRVTMRGRTFDAFVYGRRQGMSSKRGVPLQGILLDGQAVLWESPVMPLAPETLALVRELFPDGNARDRSWWSGQALGREACVALCGGKLYHFGSEEEVQALARVMAEAEGLPGPNTVLHAFVAAAGPDGFDGGVFERVAATAASAWTETPKRVLALRLDYTPAQGTPFTQQELQTQLLTSSDVIRDMSYGKTWLVPTVTPTVLVLPGSREYYQGVVDCASDAQAAAVAGGYNLDDYDIYLYSFPTSQGSPTRAIGSNMYLNGRVSPSAIVHELGHSYGLGAHANSWLDTTGSGLLGHRRPDLMGELIEEENYGDVFDLMGTDSRAVAGGTPVWPNGHYSMSMKAYLNWIEASDITTVVSSGRYRIYRFDHKDARSVPGHALALKVDLCAYGQLWVGFRRNFIKNASLSSGAYIVWTPINMQGRYAGLHRLLDTTPSSAVDKKQDMDREDAALAPNKSYTDPSGTVKITNLGWGGTAPFEYLDLEVALLSPSPAIELFTGFDRLTRGLQGSYVDRYLGEQAGQEDWRSAPAVMVAGTRVDPSLYFPTSNWGARGPLHLTQGTDADWDSFSVQWDGVIVVNRPVQIATLGIGCTAMWIDLNGDGSFGTTSPEFIDSVGYGSTQGDLSVGIPLGAYRIRIQYAADVGENSFSLASNEVKFAVCTSGDLTTTGLNASYVNKSLRSYGVQDDWRLSQTVSGSRIEFFPGYTSTGWGNRAAVGITGGSDANWDNFSVQWDGYLHVFQPMRFDTISMDGSRMWIDLNGDGLFAQTGSECINNHWGRQQNWIVGPLSTTVAPGTYRLRIQYENADGKNRFVLAGVPAE